MRLFDEQRGIGDGMDARLYSAGEQFAALFACSAYTDFVFFWALAIKRMKGHTAGLTTLLIALVLAVFVYGMPAQQAVMSASQGAVYGLLPIGWIIVTSVFVQAYGENRPI